MLGVAREELVAPMAAALARQGTRRAFVLHGKDAQGRGLDEASIEGPTTVVEVRESAVHAPKVLVPRELGIPQPGAHALAVANRDQAIAAARGLARGANDPDFRPAVADAVALQAGLGLLLHRDLPLNGLAAAYRECREALAAGFRLPLPEQVNA